MIETICDFCGGKRERRKGGYLMYFNDEERKEDKNFDLCMECCKKVFGLMKK